MRQKFQSLTWHTLVAIGFLAFLGPASPTFAKPPVSICGNGIAEQGEACDGNDLRDATCQAFGFADGQLACTANCRLDTRACSCGSGLCGNAVLDSGEQCDQGQLGGASCESLGQERGPLTCGDGCRFDVSACGSGLCGDGHVDGVEECDQGNLDGKTCATLGFAGGTLSCAGGCKLDVTGCEGGTCGNSVIDSGEQCDGPDLGGNTCSTQYPCPPGLTCDDAVGNLACSQACAFNTAGCRRCGDNILAAGFEQCDSRDANPHGQTCITRGFETGTLFCDNPEDNDPNLPNCTFDQRGCGFLCNGICAANETCNQEACNAGGCCDCCSP